MKFKILHYRSVDSTNNFARALAEEEAKEGTVVVSEYQTHGRGRFERRWVSPRGKNLLCSIILRPKLSASSVSIITHVAARSVQDLLIEKFKLAAKLKRPNDVLVGGKKIAGILTESSARGSRVDYVIVGIGLNVNGKRPSIPNRATSIWHEVGNLADVTSILHEMLPFFVEQYKIVLNSHRN